MRFQAKYRKGDDSMYNDTDFLRIDSKLRETTLKNIDNSNFLNFRKLERLDLFLFAAALGINSPTDLPKYEPLVRGELVRQRPESNAIMASIVIGNIKEMDLVDEKISRNYIWYYAERCANTGFHCIDDMLNKPEESVYIELISELDDLYEKNIKPLE